MCIICMFTLCNSYGLPAVLLYTITVLGYSWLSGCLMQSVRGANKSRGCVFIRQWPCTPEVRGSTPGTGVEPLTYAPLYSFSDGKTSCNASYPNSLRLYNVSSIALSSRIRQPFEIPWSTKYVIERADAFQTFRSSSTLRLTCCHL